MCERAFGLKTTHWSDRGSVPFQPPTLNSTLFVATRFMLVTILFTSFGIWKGLSYAPPEKVFDEGLSTTHDNNTLTTHGTETSVLANASLGKFKIKPR